jgi:hypothetical protein
VELEVSSPAANGYEHVVTKYLNVEEAYALAQRLLSAVEFASRGTDMLSLVAKEPAVSEAVNDAYEIGSLLRTVLESNPDTSAIKIYLIQAIRMHDFGDPSLSAEQRDARLRGVMLRWYGNAHFRLPEGELPPHVEEASELMLAKLVAEAWMSRTPNPHRTRP